jgi:hypothetical protein
MKPVDPRTALRQRKRDQKEAKAQKDLIWSCAYDVVPMAFFHMYRQPSAGWRGPQTVDINLRAHYSSSSREVSPNRTLTNTVSYLVLGLSGTVDMDKDGYVPLAGPLIHQSCIMASRKFRSPQLSKSARRLPDPEITLGFCGTE